MPSATGRGLRELGISTDLSLGDLVAGVIHSLVLIAQGHLDLG